jgi:superoxide reductase
MNRRDFLKGALVTTAVLSSGRSLAGEYEKKEEKGLLKLENRKDPSVLEQKHVPLIKAPDLASTSQWFDVNVKVGFMKEHPSSPSHWITMIKLLVDGREVARTEFKAGGVSASMATFRIQLTRSSTLKAVENCNLHGTWVSDPLQVRIS